MNMTDVAYKKAAVKGHAELITKQLGGNSGRYYWKCAHCYQEINYYEGEWFGPVLDRQCTEKKEPNEESSKSQEEK